MGRGADVRWYFKAGLIVAFVWATGRVLGVYGEASRDLDLNFLFAFLLTLGGWSSVFYVVDWIVRGVGLIRQTAVAGANRGGGDAGTWASRLIGRAGRALHPEKRVATPVPPAGGRASASASASVRASSRTAATKVPATPAAPTAGAARRTSRPAAKSRPRSR